MKKVLIGAFLLIGSFALAGRAEAQIRVGININVGEQPAWRAPGYDYVEYYYLPDIETYYYVPGHQFFYMSNGRWVSSSSLPYWYRNYDLYSAQKVVVNRRNAYYYFDEDRVRYGKRHDYRDNRENRDYRDNRHNQRERDNGNRNHNDGNHNDNGNHRGQNKGHDDD